MGKRSSHPLRAWRLERGLSLGQAAKCVGTIAQTWIDWERGKIPRQASMTKIFRVTGGTVTADSFYWPDGYPRLSGEAPDADAGANRNDVIRNLMAAN